MRTPRSSDAYDTDFFSFVDASATASASAVVAAVAPLVKPRSVVDLGCGTGVWLSAFKAAGVGDVYGLDGSWVDRSALRIDPGEFSAVDLRLPIRLSRRYDLAISLEVAEHLPEEAAESFVASLVRAAPVVLFSAAVPGQGGTGHLNERWPGYWAELFRRHSYRLHDCIRPRIWSDERVAWWYAQNIFLYADPMHSEELAQANTGDQPLAVVHPRLFETVVRRPPVVEELDVSTLVGALPSAISRAVRRRLAFLTGLRTR